MAIEIELKAPVGDHQELLRRLGEKASYLWTFNKEDRYWYDKDGPPLSHSVVRLRNEKRTLPDGTERSACFATYKSREIKEGIEINDEREFEVRGETEFNGFLARVNLEPRETKKKSGRAFSSGPINAELLELEGLGWFIELEIITGDRKEETLVKAREQLLGFLDSLGIERNTVESRPYTTLLRERKLSEQR